MWDQLSRVRKSLQPVVLCVGWPEPYIYTVYDRIFGDFPAKNTVHTPYIYGSGQPHLCVGLAIAYVFIVRMWRFPC